jgi:predicted Na+-dependent transporter
MNVVHLSVLTFIILSPYDNSIMNADLALSVTMTTVSTILSTAFLPMNLYIYTYAAYNDQEAASTGEDVLSSIDFGGIFLSLAIVILAIGTGIFCSWKIDTPHWHKISYLGGNISGIALIVWSTFLSFYPYDDGKLTSDEVLEKEQEKTHYLAVALPCVFGLIAASFISTAIRLPPPERLTTAVECCYQNTGIATSAAFSLFSSDPEQLSMAMLVPVIYGLVEAGAIGLYLVVFWKLGWSKAPSDENFCIVIAKSYELAPGHEDKEGDGEADELNLNSEEEESDKFEVNECKVSELVDVAKSDDLSNTDAVQGSLVS